MQRLAHAVVAVLAGAGLTLYAATRVWSVQLTGRTGLSDLRAETTGAAEMPWLLALALVALAGAGALTATLGPARRLLGGVLTLAGAGVAASAIAARTGLDPGAAGAAATLGPAACVVGGALIVLGGLSAARHGHRWPTMGSRYERRPAPPPAPDLAAGAGPSPAPGPADRRAGPSVATTARRHPADRMAGPPAPTPARPDDGGPTATPGAAPVPPPAAAAPASAANADVGPLAANDRPLPAGDPPLPAGGSLPGRRGSVAPDAEGIDREVAPTDTRAVWDALDRGEDPTAR